MDNRDKIVMIDNTKAIRIIIVIDKIDNLQMI